MSAKLSKQKCVIMKTKQLKSERDRLLVGR